MLSVTTTQPDLGWTTEQVARITGASPRRLGYWLDKGIIRADVDEARGRGRVRLWSFSNVVDARVAMWLRDRVSFEVLAAIIGHLRDQDVDQPAEVLRFAVTDTADDGDRTGVLLVSASGDESIAVPGVVVMEVVLPWGQFVAEMRDASQRDGAKRRLVRETAVEPEEPVKLTPRVSPAAIQALYYEGWPAQRIIDTFPGLTADDIWRALRARRTR